MPVKVGFLLFFDDDKINEAMLVGASIAAVVTDPS